MTKKHEDKCRSQVLVADTAAFIAGILQYYYTHHIYTTPKVINEVRDSESAEILSRLKEAGRLFILAPNKESMDKAYSIVKHLGLLPKLSTTDIEIIALTLMLKSRGCDVVILTDDYALQNVLMWINAKVVPVRTMGVKKKLVYKVVCKACGYEGKGDEICCPRCGNRLTSIARRS